MDAGRGMCVIIAHRTPSLLAWESRQREEERRGESILSTILMEKPFSFLPTPLSKFPELCLFGHLSLYSVTGHDFPH